MKVRGFGVKMQVKVLLIALLDVWGKSALWVFSLLYLKEALGIKVDRVLKKLGVRSDARA